MERDPACMKVNLGNKAHEFHEALWRYQQAGTTAAEMVGAGDVEARAAELRERFDYDMNRHMATLAQYRDDLTTLLDEMAQTGERIVAEHGEDSPEYAAHQQLNDQYVAIGEELVSVIEKVLAEHDLRDEA